MENSKVRRNHAFKEVTEVVTNGRENGHVTEVSIIEENGHVMEVASLKEGKWSCYRSGQFKGRSIVMLKRWPV